MGRNKGKQGKRVHHNKYEKAPRGPKRAGRNKGSKQVQPLEELVEVPKEQSNQKRFEKRIAEEQKINRTYWQYESWEVNETFSNWNGNVNLYASNNVDLVLYDPNARLCLLVGAWETGDLFHGQMKQFRRKTGSVVEPYKNKTLGVRTALARSTNPEEVRNYLNPGASVLVKIPKFGKGTNILISHDIEKSQAQQELNKIMIHYLQKADANYFSI